MKVLALAALALLFWQAACLFQRKNEPLGEASERAETAKTAQKRVVLAPKINGLTMVAPPKPFEGDPMQAVKNVGADWIAVVPYAFSPPGQAAVRYDFKGGQWWGERPEGVRKTIELARAAGLNVMLKPQVWSWAQWTGDYDFADPADLAAWEADYEKYMLQKAALAEETGVGLLCIGTEFRALIRRHPTFWSALIDKIRTVYRGKLTYSANWDDWQAVPFWPKLDFVGLGGYFPLVEAATPSAEALKSAWRPIAERLRTLSDSLQKPVLFTEYGYLSVDGCGWQNWELEKGIEKRPINEQAQANCLDALHEVFQNESWWAGGFLWKWFPEGMGHEGYPERDYTPQGKLGEAVLRKHFSAKN